jgi:acyl-coenzyme A thioesterase PaaI-like protein
MGLEVQLIMRVATGRVIDGKVVVEGEPLVEGSTVTVFLPEPDEEIELTVEESRLAQAVREADEGDFIEEDAERFLDELDRQS